MKIRLKNAQWKRGSDNNCPKLWGKTIVETLWYLDYLESRKGRWEKSWLDAWIESGVKKKNKKVGSCIYFPNNWRSSQLARTRPLQAKFKASNWDILNPPPATDFQNNWLATWYLDFLDFSRLKQFATRLRIFPKTPPQLPRTCASSKARGFWENFLFVLLFDFLASFESVVWVVICARGDYLSYVTEVYGSNTSYVFGRLLDDVSMSADTWQ